MEIFRTRRQYPAAPPHLFQKRPSGCFLWSVGNVGWFFVGIKMDDFVARNACGKLEKNYKKSIQKVVDLSIFRTYNRDSS